MGMMTKRFIVFMAALLLSCGCYGEEPAAAAWRQVFADDFTRPALGANWRWVFGDGRQYIRENAIHLSHSATVYCVVPLPHGDVRVELDLLLPTQSFSGTQAHALSLALRGGEVGGGGNDERFEALVLPESEPLGAMTSPGGAAKAIDANTIVRVTLDQPYHIVLQIAGGSGSVTVNGKPQFQKNVGLATSEVNRYFVFSTIGLNGIPGKEAVLDNFAVYAGTNAAEKLPLQANTPEENRQATRRAADFIDPANPALGIQKAIDSLPPTGGLVLLPEGEFLMRRHLRLRNHVTLQGQGAGKTILKAVKSERCPIVELKSSPGQCVVTVAPADAAKFKPGDGVCFGENWNHPGALDSINKDCVVRDVSGNSITVAGIAPAEGAKQLSLWFPMLYAHCAEFVEVKDLTIESGADGWGNFMSPAVNLGQVSGARVSRVHVARWRADGISLQTGADALVLDNTVYHAQQGFHPGTVTQRFLWTRNLSLDNWCGLYFCYFNRNGVYHRNTLDWFDGYAWPRDVFDVIDRNVCVSAKDFAIEQGEGGGGVIVNNQFAQIRVGGGRKGSPTFDFVVAGNRADTLRFVDGNVERCLFAGNRTRAGDQPTAVTEPRDKNFFADSGAELDLRQFPAGIERTTPVDPPVLPRPILDGAAFYRPEKPDAGFQAGLDQLAKSGGTLLLPAGRYGLAQSLNVPAGVTLAGCGLGTVLHAARPEQTGSLIVVGKGERATVRDLVILGEYERRAFRSPAIAFQDVGKAELVAVDVRGWEGTAVQVTGGGVQLRDCRALGCAGNGFEFVRCQVVCEGNIARECASGFVVSQGVAGSLLEANIAGGNRGSGYQVAQSAGIQLYANNASFNDGDGIRVTDTDKADLVANMLANNNQAVTADGCGIRLTGNTRNCRLHYNNLQDEQNQATQTRAIVEDASAGSNLIRLNLARAPIQAAGQGSTVTDNFKP